MMGIVSQFVQDPFHRLWLHFMIFVCFLCAGGIVFQYFECHEEEIIVTYIRSLRNAFFNITNKCISGKYLHICKIIKG